MRIGLYDPYLDTLGGGERYILTAAACLAQKYDVRIFWDDNSCLDKAEKKFNLDLSKVKTEKNVFTTNNSFLQRLSVTMKYDLVIFMSDGSIPFLFSKKNILLFQFPVNWIDGQSPVTKLKLKRIEKIICYTDFVKRYLDKTFTVSSTVIYPPVDQIKGDKKENIILSVGRFTKAMNAKKQEVLVNTFKRMCDQGLKEWKLVLAGSYLPEDKDFLKEIEKLSQGYPIKIAANAPYETLTNYYKKSKIYWHAAGFGEDLVKHPERAEHFGITTVESMAAGCIPIVINSGGQKEIVTNKKSGFLWDTLDELESRTVQIISDDQLRQEISQNAILRANDFNKEKFCRHIHSLLQ